MEREYWWREVGNTMVMWCVMCIRKTQHSLYQLQTVGLFMGRSRSPCGHMMHNVDTPHRAFVTSVMEIENIGGEKWVIQWSRNAQYVCTTQSIRDISHGQWEYWRREVSHAMVTWWAVCIWHTEHSRYQTWSAGTLEERNYRSFWQPCRTYLGLFQFKLLQS